MRHYVLFFLSAFYGVLLYAQEITSDLSVYISPYSKEDTLALDDHTKVDYFDFGIFPVHVTQTIHLKEEFSDHLELEMKHPSFLNATLQGLFFNDLSVIAKSGNSSSDTKLRFDFNGGKIIIYPPYLSSVLEISYRYQSDFPIKMQNNVLYYLQPVMADWHSWYFTQSSMKISHVTVTYPEDEAFLFVNFPMVVNSPVCYFDFEDCPKTRDDQNLSFYLLNKRFYRHESISGAAFELNLFISKEVKIDTFCVDVKGVKKQCIALKSSDHYTFSQIDSLKNKMKESMNEIVSFFGSEDSVVFNIADADLGTPNEKGERIRWGRTVKSSDRNYFILQDTSFWRGHDCIHELIHPFIRHSSDVSDQAHFFLEESMVDYLAVCFYTTDGQKRDSIFNDRMTAFNRIDPSVKSIFNLESDFVSLDEESDGTSYVIYKKTPYVIHQFAKSIGEERFLSAVQDYYKTVNQTSVSSFEQFEKVMKRHGISDQQWDGFVSLL